MQATADTLDLNPPGGGRWRGPMGAALVVHALLILALTWGVGWQRDTVVVAEAELWSRLPQVAAPRANEPEPPPPPAPEPRPEPAPTPPPPPAPAPAPPGPSQADIALQKQREQEQAEKARAERLRLEAERKKQEEARQAEARRKAQQAEREAAAKREEERQRREAQAQKDKQAREKAEAARQQAQLEAERQKNLERMMGQANAMGGATARGTATQSSGPSANYGGRLVARIRPNIVFADTVNGNPRAEVEVRALPDGTIVGSKLLKSSGHTAWDDAVLRAIERTGKLPQDENGRVPSTLILGFRPQD